MRKLRHGRQFRSGKTCRVCAAPTFSQRLEQCRTCRRVLAALAKKRGHDDQVSLRRLFALRQRAEAGLPLFTRQGDAQ